MSERITDIKKTAPAVCSVDMGSPWQEEKTRRDDFLKFC